MASDDSVDKREWNLERETEYRFELDPDSSLAIKAGLPNGVVKGHAEVFGAELAANRPYIFGQECKAAIYTWEGCTIEMSGHPSTEYVSEETPMVPYGNVHYSFEKMRVLALSQLRGSPVPASERDKPAEPPRVLVVGPENSGKTTLCKILTNYAVRMGQGWSPLLVNLDPAEGGWAAPGAIGVTPVHTPLPTSTPASPLGTAATSAPTALSSNALLPLAYWYGHAETKRNPLLMERIIRNIGENIKDKYQAHPEGKDKKSPAFQAAGFIVDTPSSFATGSGSNEERQRLIKATIDAFKINTILVVGHEKLNVELQRAYGSQITVVKVPKSGGVVELDYLYRERVHKSQLHAYFYGQVIPPPAGITSASFGSETLVLSPSSSILNFDDLSIYRIGAESMAPSSALPIGAARVVSETQAVPVDPSSPGSGLLNAVLAILATPSTADDAERYDEEILDLSVSGFVVVTNIDMPNRKMTILSPNQGSIVGRTAVIGSYEWQE
ncbi:mRNA cleavage and polyadenylation factor CLP1 [Mycena indigotica]|uniref:Polynucleotide 5'-hydroxyl-kinase GRC3 n=1 Tax=Mycena indigotica TaxID=2126181 RepID=A0A8H6SB19_9AGAR|nr:mRNA cleavage and polyadenylation factor CLP1 [Mycena indigotica]KAF7295436.1 mRNA cleavage and polyadenylation factor CLP1 [Mycena indigotica]